MRRARQVFLLTVFLVSLAGCEKLFAQPDPVFSDTALAEDYVLNLTLAQLALTPPGDTITAARPYVNALSGEKNARQPVSVTLLSMDYNIPSENKKCTLLAPVSLNGSADFPRLATVLKHLAGAPYTLQDVHAHVITFRPHHIRWSGEDAALLRRQLAWQQTHIMADAKPLPPFTDARLQLQLTRFFMQQDVRDAAYLTMENTKLALARATTEKAADPADIAALSKEADTLEGELHKTMPYKL